MTARLTRACLVAFVAQTTLEEQVGLMTGVGWSVGPRPRCVGDIAPIERLSWPGLCLEDSPLGVRFAVSSCESSSPGRSCADFGGASQDLVSVYPTGLSTAAVSTDEGFLMAVVRCTYGARSGVVLLAAARRVTRRAMPQPSTRPLSNLESKANSTLHNFTGFQQTSRVQARQGHGHGAPHEGCQHPARPRRQSSPCPSGRTLMGDGRWC